MSDDLGRRSYFVTDGDPSKARLRIQNVNDGDKGVFRCRVDFVNSPTKNFQVNLALIGKKAGVLFGDMNIHVKKLFFSVATDPIPILFLRGGFRKNTK